MRRSNLTKLILAGFILIFFNLIYTDYSYTNYYNQNKINLLQDKETYKTPKMGAYSPLHIQGSSGWIDAKARGLCTGSGTESDPYIIANKTFVSNYSVNYALKIENSHYDYFKIYNITCINSTSDSASSLRHSGLNLANTNLGTVDSVHCFNNSIGVYVTGSMSYDNFNIIKNSNCSNNLENGIRVVDWAYNTTVKNNIINNNGNYGCYLSRAVNNTVKNNRIKDNVNNGLYMYLDVNNVTADNNTIMNNGKYGLHLWSVENVKVKNNIIKENGWDGVYMYSNVNNVTVDNNIIKENERYGVFISDVSNSTIRKNNIEKNQEGIRAQNQVVNNKIISNKIINNTAEGFSTYYSGDNTRDFLFYNNTIAYNTDGIKIDGDTGDPQASNFTICYNNISFNSDDGIDLEKSNNTIMYNNITHNNNRGIYFSSISDNNIVFQNRFIENTVNARSDGSPNWFNTSTAGNYWADYPGVDADDDFIGDTPYDITGGFYDYLPLWHDGYIRPPTIIDESGNGDYTWAEAASEKWCNGSGTQGDPYVLDYLVIEGNETRNGLTIKNSNSPYFKITNTKSVNATGTETKPMAGIYILNSSHGYIDNANCTGNGIGIHLENVNNITIKKSNITANHYYGIQINASSEQNSLYENSINSNGFKEIMGAGIFFNRSNNNRVFNNLIINNTYNGILGTCCENEIISNQINQNSRKGIYLLTQCDNWIIQNNTLKDNNWGTSQTFGIHMVSSDSVLIDNNHIENTEDNGLRINNSYNASVINNSIFSNYDGIVLEENTNNCTLYNNRIKYNTQWGLRIITSSADNLFYQNYFITNTQHANISVSGNYFNNSVIGNYWDDYSYQDYDNNGIGDIPYNLTNAYDYLPIWEDGIDLISIVIDDNSGGAGDTYDWAEAEDESWCNGSGTQVDPYVIKNVNFIAKYKDYGLTIRDSSAYFKLVNVTFINGTDTLNNGKSGLYLDYCSNGEIINATFTKNHNGIYLYNSDDIDIINSTFINNDRRGIYCHTSNKLYFYNNKIMNNGFNSINSPYGIDLFRSPTNVFEENYIFNNSDCGIGGLQGSNYNIINNNTIIQNTDHGIDFNQNCVNNTIANNTISNHPDAAIYISSGMRTIIEYNNLSGNPAGAIELRYGVGGIIRYNEISGCSGSVIYLYDSTNQTIYRNNITNNQGTAISTGMSNSGNNISYNIIRDNTGTAISMGSNPCDNMIWKNTIDTNSIGILFTGGPYRNKIFNNSITNSVNNGIELSGSVSTPAVDNSIFYNNITDNHDHGISLEDYCYRTTVYQNRIINNFDYGINIAGVSNGSLIYRNDVFDNGLYGLRIQSGCLNNTVYLNNFTGNSQNADILESSTNLNTTSIGNYWDDYSDPDGGSDWDDNGIGDYPFAVGVAYDYLPIWDDGPNDIPTVGTPKPLDFTISPLSSGNVVNWTINDPNARNQYFEIYINGTYNDSLSGTWTPGVEFHVSVDGLTGVYNNVTIIAYDSFGGNVTDQVWVIVNFIPEYILPSNNSLFFENGTVGNQLPVKITDYEKTNGSYYVLKDGSAFGSPGTWENDTLFTIDLDSLNIGFHNITIFANDGVNTSSHYVLVSVYDNPIYNLRPERTFIYLNGTQNNYLIWNLTDANIFTPTFTIYRNGTEVPGNVSLPWSSEVPIEINIDGLDSGHYNYTLIANDGMGGTYTDEILLIVNTNSTFISPEFSIEFYDILLPRSFNVTIRDPDINNTDAVFTVYQNGTILDSYQEVVWTSEVPNNISLESLAPGLYNITIQATDGISSDIELQVWVSIYDNPTYIARPSREIIVGIDTHGNTLSWTLDDANTKNPTFTIYRNSTAIPENTSLSWTSGTPLNINIDGLSIGFYNYSIIALDGFGGSYQDEVLIIVNNNNMTYNRAELENTLIEVGADNHLFINISDYVYRMPTYSIFDNGSDYLVSQSWAPNIEYSHNLNDLTVGRHNITIVAVDGVNETIKSEIWVDVYNNPVINANPGPSKSYLQYSSGHQLKYTVQDSHTPHPTYSIWIDSSLTQTNQVWESNVEETINLDDLIGYNSLKTYNFTIEFYDGFGGSVSHEVSIEIVSTSGAPSITINRPNEGQIYNETTPLFNVYITDSDLNTTWYILNGGSKVIFIDNGSLLGWDSLPNGSVTITFYANDTLGNQAMEAIQVYKDSLFPQISLNSPVPNELFGRNAPEFSLTLIESNFDSSWYSLNSGATNITFSGTEGSINQSLWDLCENGTVTIDFYVKDLAGHINSTQIIVRKDIVNIPEISFNSLIRNQLFGNSPPYLEVMLTSLHGIANMWYTLNGSSEIPFITNSSIEQAAWNLQSNGTVFLVFSTNDTLGNVANETIQIQKDIIGPIISVLSPSEFKIFKREAPTFEITADDANFEDAWFVINGGSDKYPMNDLEGSIPASVWTSLPNDTITIDFYANDTLGNTGTTRWHVIKLSSSSNGDGPTDEPSEDSLPILFIIIIGMIVGVVLTGLLIARRGKKKKEIEGQAVQQPKKKEPTATNQSKARTKIATSAVKKKKKKKSAEATQKKKLTPAERKELQKTEQEMSIAKDKKICLVCRTFIKGASYVCPKCENLYCLKCALALAEKGEGCWNCQEKFDLDTGITSKNKPNSQE